LWQQRLTGHHRSEVNRRRRSAGAELDDVLAQYNRNYYLAMSDLTRRDE